MTYSYDEAGQLTRVNDPRYGTTVYVYDVGGNIKYVRSYDYTTGELGACKSTVTYNYTDAWKDLLTSYNGQSITYDGAGNPLTYRDGMQLTWELGRQLKTAACNGKTYTYKYNSDGLRTQKTDGTVTTDFYWANGNLTYQDDGTNELYFCYDDAGAPVSVNINGTDYYYVKNLQGDIIALLDGQGTCMVKYTYDAWGKVLSVEDSTETNIGTINPLRYRGYYYDSALGFYYLQSRYYDPTLGRFLNADSTIFLGVGDNIVSYNLFTYCGNNAVMGNDPSGNYSIAAEANWLVAALFGSMMTLKASGSALIAKVTALILTVAPYLFWTVVAVAAVVTSVFLVRKAIVTRADNKIRRTVTKNSRTRYWTATVKSNYVDIGRSLTYSQAVREVASGRSVFTVTQYEAKAVALAAGGRTGRNNKALYPEIDTGKNNVKGYYWHYHTYNRRGGHVYYLF